MDKERLQNENWKHYYLLTFKNGVGNTLLTWWRFLLFAAFCAALVAFCPDVHAHGTNAVLTTFAYFLFASIIILAMIYANGAQRGTRRYYHNFSRVGFVNAAGEAPLLIARAKRGNTERLDFIITGLPSLEWNARKEYLETALDAYIVEIRPKRGNLAAVQVFVVPSSSELPDYLPWDDKYIDLANKSAYALGRSLEGNVTFDAEKQPHLLIGGSTGSGKSRLTYNICYQALSKGANVLIYDGKGLDYKPLNNRYGFGAKIIKTPGDLLAELEKSVEDMNERLNFFEEIVACSFPAYLAKIEFPMLHYQWIVIDECAGLLDPIGRTKEEKEQIASITADLAAIAQKGRAVGYHLLISTQRPDMNAVPGVLKSNIDLRICGKADTTLSTIILGDGRADDAIPRYSQGRFIMADGAKDIIFQAFWMEE